MEAGRYTDMIHLDGKVERLVDNNEDAQVDPWEITNGAKGYNSTSRHVVYVGGVPLTARPPRTPVPPRRRSNGSLRERLPPAFPSIPVVGHNQLAAKACPSFDVPAWLESVGIKQ